MAKYPVAYLNIDENYMIIIPLESEFQNYPIEQKYEIIKTFQKMAFDSGLRGVVVPIWQVKGITFSLPPSNYKPYFRNISFESIKSKLNAVISD